MVIFALLAAVTQSGTTMTDDWHPLTIVQVGQTTEGPYYLDVRADDLDGDGVPDDAYLKLVCADGKLQQALYQVKGPRDSASGQASGKRMHKPLTVVKEWGPASPQLMSGKAGYDLKLEKKARMAANADGWTPLSLSSGDELCPALAAQRSTIVKSKSNITNNKAERG